MPTRQRPRSTSEAADRKARSSPFCQPAKPKGRAQAPGAGRDPKSTLDCLPPHVVEHGPIRVAECLSCGRRWGVYGRAQPRGWRDGKCGRCAGRVR